jgi:hypothetical protein
VREIGCQRNIHIAALSDCADEMRAQESASAHLPIQSPLYWRILRNATQLVHKKW